MNRENRFSAPNVVVTTFADMILSKPCGCGTEEPALILRRPGHLLVSDREMMARLMEIPTWTRRKVQLMVPKDLWITGIEDRNLVLNVPRTTCAVYRSDKIAKEGKETKHS